MTDRPTPDPAAELDLENGDVDDVRIVECRPVLSPAEVRAQAPLTAEARHTVLEGRAEVRAVLDGRDPRPFVVVGPCSIHDPEAALEYAERLARLNERVREQLVLVMRVYFEKPRTTVGWKGFINDPHLDDSFHIDEGLVRSRRLLVDIAEMGLPAGTEALDPIVPQYLADLISWYAIGARTTESQTHREMASGLSAPVGFKNSTDGSVQVAVNALAAASEPHHFLGITAAGRLAVFQTGGNPYGHVILRGGPRPNHDAASVAEAVAALRKASLREAVVIDCSHANSAKDPGRQPAVLADGVAQRVAGNPAIVGFMLESHLEEGNQPMAELGRLRRGVSITDACLGWEATERALLQAAEGLSGAGSSRAGGHDEPRIAPHVP